MFAIIVIENFMEINLAHAPEHVQNPQRMRSEQQKRLKLDEIGEWSELKLDILRKYAGAYCTILKARNFHRSTLMGSLVLAFTYAKQLRSLCREVR